MPDRSGWRLFALAAAVLAACGVAAASPSAVLAGPSAAATWTKLPPPTHPPARFAVAIVYDAATGTAVLVRDTIGGRFLATWTWDGSTWAQQHPATSPAARGETAMAYDAATGTVVVFSGKQGRHPLADTWTWG